MLIQRDHSEHMLRDRLRLFEGVPNRLAVGVEIGVDAGSELLLELVVAVALQELVDLLDLVIAEAFHTLDIADQSDQIHFFWIDLLQKKGAVGLADDIQH